MPGSDKLPHWKRVALTKFSEIKSHPDFAEDVYLIRSLLPAHTLVLDSLVKQFLAKYDLPNYMYEFLKNYLILREEDPDDLMPPVFLINEYDATVMPSDYAFGSMIALQEHDAISRTKKLTIEITPDAQREDIEAFIADYYREIDSILRRQFPERVRSHKSRENLKHRYAVIQAYKDMKADPAYSRGLHDAIQRKTGVSPPTIKKIIEQYNEQKKRDIKIPEKYIAT